MTNEEIYSIIKGVRAALTVFEVEATSPDPDFITLQNNATVIAERVTAIVAAHEEKAYADIQGNFGLVSVVVGSDGVPRPVAWPPASQGYSIAIG